jgi:hypothetical protein
MKFKKLLFAMACCLSVSTVYAADTVSITESSTDKLLTHKYREEGETFTEYEVENTGKFSITAKISGDSLNEAGIFWEDITEDATMAISVGNFAFQSSLSEADKHKLSASKLTANWSEKSESCTDAENPVCKTTVLTKISLSAGSNSNLTLKVNGSSKGETGQNMFASLCTENENGVSEVEGTASLRINESTLSTPLSVKCSVKTKSVTKSEESYDLNTVKVTGKIQL